MNSESLQMPENHQQRDVASTQTQPSEGLEFDSLIISARNDESIPVEESITETDHELESSQAEKGTQSSRTLKDINQNDAGLDQKQLAEAISYLSKNPHEAPVELLLALGEHITIDAAQEASTKSRLEIIKATREHPEDFRLLYKYIKTIGSAHGMCWVPEKDVAASVQAALLARSEQTAKGRLRRAYDVITGNDVNLFQALTEQVEQLYAHKIALEQDVAATEKKLAKTIEEIANNEAEAHHRLQQQQKEMMDDQLSRQERLFNELNSIQEQITQIRSEQAGEILDHNKRMLELKNESLIQISELESKYRMKELELEAKLTETQARFSERAALLRTEMAVIREANDEIRLKHGLVARSLTERSEIEKSIIEDIKNDTIFRPIKTTSELALLVARTATKFIDLSQDVDPGARLELAKRLQNEIGQRVDLKIPKAQTFLSLLERPDLSEVRNQIRDFAEKPTASELETVHFSRTLHLALPGFFDAIRGAIPLCNISGTVINEADYRALDKLAKLCNLLPEDLLGVAEVDYYNKSIREIHLSELISKVADKKLLLDNSVFAEFTELQILHLQSVDFESHYEQVASILKQIPASVLIHIPADKLEVLSKLRPDLKRIKIFDEGSIDAIANFTNLNVLAIEGAFASLKPLSRLTDLKTLELKSITSLEQLSGLSNLASLKILKIGELDIFDNDFAREELLAELERILRPLVNGNELSYLYLDGLKPGNGFAVSDQFRKLLT